ncbi:MAG: hypothetical protein U1E51_21020, partial [Candidatus Binatia bacterium]|nr:hypothetical protein [Candidatus Binatia bacterium]
LVPWRDSQTIASVVVDLLSNDAKRLALCARAAVHGRGMLWPAVARRYLQSFDRACGRETSAPRIGQELPVRARHI